MANRTLNTFGKLNTDVSVNNYPSNGYYGAKNLRKITNDSLSTGAMNNFPAPSEVFSDDLSSTGTVLGTTLVRDTLVVFFVNTAGDSIIYKAKTTDSGYTVVYNDNLSTSKLDFDSTKPIRAIGRYESEEVQKVYWCDGTQPNSFINIAEDHFTPSTKEASLFRLSPDAELNSPVPQEVLSGGILESGTIYYTYQLYRKYGNQTSMSPSSFGVPLSSRNGNDLENFRGDEVGVVTGDSVLVKFDNLDSNFDRIRIYSIHFSDINADPTINLISEQQFSDTTLFHTDSGAISLSTLTVEEFLIQGGRIFSSETLETKYNYLFPGNITEISTDVDFDARVYGFPISSLTTTVYDGGSPQVVDGTYTLDSDSDAVNYYNDFDNDIQYLASGSRSSYDYRFQRNSTIPGGSGANASYIFITQNLEGNRTSGGKATDNYSRRLVDSSQSLINPILAGKYKGYKRNEVYRIGVEILFTNGQKSFVKWIGDIRFPNFDDIGLTNLNGSVIETQQLGLRLTIDFSSLSASELADMSGFRIVRAKRDFQDKNILSQGIAGPYLEYTDGSSVGISGNFYGTNLRLAYMSEVGGTSALFNAATIPNRPYTTGDTIASTLNISDTIFEYISPETNINKNAISYNGGDRVYANDLTLNTPGHTRAPAASGTSPYGIFREDNYVHNNSSNVYITDVDGSRFLNVNYSAGTGSLTSFAANTIYNRTYIQKSGVAVDSSKGSSTILDLTAFSSLGGSGTDTLILDYVRNRFNSQYGGNTYESRTITNYIPALCRLGTAIGDDVVEFIPKSYLTGTSATVDVFGGDTYTCYFDNLRAGFQQGDRLVNATAQHYITFPVESSINLEYRRDEMNKYLTTNTAHAASADSYKVQEEKTQGLIWNPDNYPDELTDLNLYNDAYSRGNDIVTNTSRPIDFQETLILDTIVLASNKKFNNEDVDSWTRYDFNTFLEVDSTYGGITSLKTYKDRLFYFQPHGFGILAVEDRLQTTTSSGSLLSLGAGAVLERYDYVSTDFGCLRDEAVLSTPNNLYFIDETDNSIRVISDSDLNGNLSKIKGVNSLLRTYLPSTYIALGYDPQYKEVLFSFDDDTLVYSELDQEFIGNYDYFADQTASEGTYTYKADRYEYINDKLYLISFATNSAPYPLRLYEANGGTTPLGEYSEITVLIHPNGNDIFVFDVLDLRTNVFTNFTQSLPDDSDIADDTVSSIIYQNSYISPITVTTDPGGASALINRLARAWKTQVPLTGNSNRFVDTYLLATLRFDHTTNRKIVLYDLTTHIRRANSNI